MDLLTPSDPGFRDPRAQAHEIFKPVIGGYEFSNRGRMRNRHNGNVLTPLCATGRLGAYRLSINNNPHTFAIGKGLKDMFGLTEKRRMTFQRVKEQDPEQVALLTDDFTIKCGKSVFICY